ncbi:hypothetical protein H2201_008617 [Coniosporium apollinis]|uniref:RlpA-like protein double-psi beta-barrel domain-containing protein n=1 Tax=Coniosporium apollinis TaxID=61459 RepID=A0ABQ9NJY1_9PEZI|nr:hypothetical protein H2201_008617 [Coniosporium apollinis]
MKNISIFALSSLLLSVSAVPMKAKRDIVWVTETAEVVETVQVTKTVWVNATGRPNRNRYSRTRASTSTVETTSLSTSTVYVAPSTSTPEVVPTTAEAPSSTYVAPTTTETPATTEAPSSTYVPPPPPATTEAPSSTYVAPVAPVSSAAPAVSIAPVEKAVASTSTSSASYTGELTWYETGLGSCGIVSGSTEPIVAISHVLYDATKIDGNPNHNTICGKKISIEYAGKSHVATVVDRCPGCKEGDLDLSNGFFNTVTNFGDGRVYGAKWSFIS